jgi:hypothetical protein
MGGRGIFFGGGKILKIDKINKFFFGRGDRRKELGARS